jgi:hypothetical protein
MSLTAFKQITQSYSSYFHARQRLARIADRVEIDGDRHINKKAQKVISKPHFFSKRMPKLIFVFVDSAAMEIADSGSGTSRFLPKFDDSIPVLTFYV